jgi:hypothetical protein
VSGRGRLVFVGACLLAFAAVATWVLSSPSRAPQGGSPAPGTPGGARPAGPAVVDLNDAAQLQARFNADKGAPRLLLALSPT